MPQALKRIPISAIEQFLESGDDCGIFELLEAAIVQAKAADGMEAAVQFFVVDDTDDDEAEDE